MFVSPEYLTNQFAYHCPSIRIILPLQKRWNYYQDIPFSIDCKSMLEIKGNVFTNFTNSSQHETNFSSGQLKNNYSSFHWNGRWKEVSYDRTNGYEQVGEIDIFLWDKRFTKQRKVYTEILMESFVSYFISVKRKQISWDLYHDEPVNSTSSSACQE